MAAKNNIRKQYRLYDEENNLILVLRDIIKHGDIDSIRSHLIDIKDKMADDSKIIDDMNKEEFFKSVEKVSDLVRFIRALDNAIESFKENTGKDE